MVRDRFVIRIRCEPSVGIEEREQAASSGVVAVSHCLVYQFMALFEIRVFMFVTQHTIPHMIL